METPKQKKVSIKDKAPRKRKSTVMIIGSVGKVRSFKISNRLVFYTCLFFVLYIPISLLIINDWFELRRVMVIQSGQIKDLEKGISTSKKILYKSKQRIALLEDYIINFEERQEESERPTKGKDVKEPGSTQSTGQAPKEQVERTESNVTINIKNMVIQREKSMMTVNFNLVNTKPDDDPASGYIHVVAMDRKVDPTREWVYPKVELQNGVPLNYRRGKPFLIKRFKPIQGEFILEPDSKTPSYIKVLVYDQTGNLILKEEFEVGGAS
ncbi:MAG: hypothetical protein ABII26_02745 [Pseudomonadota bacterium]